MKIEYIVLTVQKWELTDEKTGKVKNGISIHYIDPASKFEQPEKVGAKLIKTTADLKFFGKFGELPGTYKFEWGLESVSIGKDQKIVLQDVEFIKPVDFEELDQSLNKIDDILTKINEELPKLLEGKVDRNQIPSVMNNLKTKIPELNKKLASLK